MSTTASTDWTALPAPTDASGWIARAAEVSAATGRRRRRPRQGRGHPVRRGPTAQGLRAGDPPRAAEHGGGGQDWTDRLPGGPGGRPGRRLDRPTARLPLPVELGRPAGRHPRAVASTSRPRPPGTPLVLRRRGQPARQRRGGHARTATTPSCSPAASPSRPAARSPTSRYSKACWTAPTSTSSPSSRPTARASPSTTTGTTSASGSPRAAASPSTASECRGPRRPATRTRSSSRGSTTPSTCRPSSWCSSTSTSASPQAPWRPPPTYTRTKTRPWLHGGHEQAVDEPYVIDVYGDLTAKLWAGRGIRRSGGRGGAAAPRRPRRRHRRATRGEFEVRVAAAKAVATDVALEITSRIFEVTGARSTAIGRGSRPLLAQRPHPHAARPGGLQAARGRSPCADR